jgi:hypothetical protein
VYVYTSFQFAALNMDNDCPASTPVFNEVKIVAGNEGDGNALPRGYACSLSFEVND